MRQAGLQQESEHLGQDYLQEFGRELSGQELRAARRRRGARPGSDDRGTGTPASPAAADGDPSTVLAADEYDEHRERHEFLTAQQGDVTDSIESLRRTIRDIDKTSSERFVTAFREVNENFGHIFTELFRGGEAEMRLMDEDDPLDCGIEITARPPGKRAQNIMLLSGGEKALAAIALLFALFQTKPSPFCILDEVDAPLDDANILRFVDMLKRMSADTQFLVITHNKADDAGRQHALRRHDGGTGRIEDRRRRCRRDAPRAAVGDRLSGHLPGAPRSGRDTPLPAARWYSHAMKRSALPGRRPPRPPRRASRRRRPRRADLLRRRAAGAPTALPGLPPAGGRELRRHARADGPDQLRRPYGPGPSPSPAPSPLARCRPGTRTPGTTGPSPTSACSARPRSRPW